MPALGLTYNTKWKLSVKFFEVRSGQEMIMSKTALYPCFMFIYIKGEKCELG